MKANQIQIGAPQPFALSNTNSNLFSFSATCSLHFAHHHEHPAHS